MRIKHYDESEIERIERPKVARFRQTTHHRPRNTRRDRVQAMRELAELGLTSDTVREV
jgi:hypothetical protein